MNALSLLYKGGEDASVRVTYGLMRETQKMLTARFLLDKGSSDDEVAAAIGMHPYRCKLTFLPNVRKHDQTSLIRVMRRLCKLDQEVKGASSSKRTLVELTVLSIAG
jgi:DNA polymerase III delta subunit